MTNRRPLTAARVRLSNDYDKCYHKGTNFSIV